MEVGEERGEQVEVFIHEIWEVKSIILIKKPVYDTCVWFVDAILACQAVDNGTRQLLVTLRQIVSNRPKWSCLPNLLRTCQVNLLLKGLLLTIN